MNNIKHMGRFSTGYCKTREGKQLQEKRKPGSKMRRKAYLSLLASGMHYFTEDNIQRVCKKLKCSKAHAILEIKKDINI